jgi:hypothetical protein
VDGGTDAADAESEASVDASSADGDAGAGPALLVPGTGLIVQAITADGYVLYLDSSSNTYYVQSVGGGTPTQIVRVPTSGSSYSFASGKLALVSTWGNPPTYASTLTVWSAALGTPTLISTNSLLEYFQTTWPSDDSKYLVYTRPASADQTVGNVYGVNADGTNETLLVANVALSPTSCVASARFAGGYVVIAYCPSADAGTATVQNGHSVAAFSVGGSWAPALAVPNSLATFAVDPAGTEVVTAPLASDAGGLQLFPIDGGGAGTAIDPATPFGSGQSLLGSKSSPWYVIYNSGQGALRQTYLSPLSSQTLVDAGVNYVPAESADGRWAMAVNRTTSGGLAADLSVVSTLQPGTPIQVSPSSTYDAGVGVLRFLGPLTGDDKYVLFATNLARTSASAYEFYVRSMALATPNAFSLLSNGYAIYAFSLGGSKTLLIDNFQDSDGGAGVLPMADLDLVDPASAATGTTVVRGVPIHFDTGAGVRNVEVTSDYASVVYATSQGSAPGIYVASIP